MAYNDGQEKEEATAKLQRTAVELPVANVLHRAGRRA